MRLPKRIEIVPKQNGCRCPATLEVAPLGAGDGDAFIHNQTLIRAEERLAVVYPRPAALCIIDLSGGSSS
jgi:hypothetical protein